MKVKYLLIAGAGIAVAGAYLYIKCGFCDWTSEANCSPLCRKLKALNRPKAPVRGGDLPPAQGPAQPLPAPAPQQAPPPAMAAQTLPPALASGK